MQTFLFVTLAILGGSIGNILIKLSAKNLPQTFSFDTVLKIFTQPLFLLGILLMVGSFPFYSLALQRLPLNVGVPILLIGTFIVVLVASYFFFHEPLTLTNWLGIIVLILGLLLVAQK